MVEAWLTNSAITQTNIQRPAFPLLKVCNYLNLKSEILKTETENVIHKIEKTFQNFRPKISI